MLADIEKELNPKAFEGTVIELQVELSQINNTIFDHIYDKIKESGKQPKWKELENMKRYGMVSIEYARKTLEVLEAKEDFAEYLQAVFNLRFTIAKIYSRCYHKEEEEQFKLLEKSFREYTKLQEFVKKVKDKDPKAEMSETMQA
jgi:hypothetical protein